MVWKMFFVVSAILIMLINIIGFNSNNETITNLQCLISLLVNINIVFIIGIFYSLGWKQKIFSQKITNIFITFFIICIILFMITYALKAYNDAYAQTQDALVSYIVVIIGSLICTGIINAFLIPFYIGLYKYKKTFDTLELTDKPYWKLFSIYCIIILVAFVISALTKYAHFSSYNFIDYLVICSGIYEIMLLLGFAWNVKIFNRLFWRITAIPYVLLLFVSPFLMSDTFNNDFQITKILSNSIVSVILTFALYIIFLYIIYKYVFAKEKSTNI